MPYLTKMGLGLGRGSYVPQAQSVRGTNSSVRREIELLEMETKDYMPDTDTFSVVVFQ